MNIGIITLSGYDNIGNRLQNLAIEKLFRQYSTNVETIFVGLGYNYSLDNHQSFYYNYNLLEKKYGKDYNKIKKEIIKQTKDFPLKKERINRFISLKKFSDLFLNERDINTEIKSLSEIEDEYDYFIVGSDQVWNPEWVTSDYLLGFTSDRKKIAYAPSFGVSELPKGKKKIYQKLLSDFTNISVREFTGQDIIRDLIKKEVPVVLDPTLMFNKERWLSYAAPHVNKPDGKYILTYILGNYTKQISNDINILRQRYNLEVVDLGRIEIMKYINVSPNEFLDYMYNATILLTDSFHGIVFSNILKTPYIIYERVCYLPSMNSRIATLENLFNVNKRKVENLDLKSDKLFDYDINFEAKREQLELASRQYLDNILTKKVNVSSPE